MRESVKSRIDSIQRMLDHLPLIKDPHSEFVLLRSCFSLPKLVFLLRTIDPSILGDLLDTFDEMIRDSLNHILGSSLNDFQWNQAQLPVSMGGMGLRGARSHAPGAFSASVLSSDPLRACMVSSRDVKVDLHSAIILLNSNISEAVTEHDLVDVSQKAISLRIDQHSHQTLLQSLTETRDIARLNSLSLPHAGDWLNVVPNPVLGLHLNSKEFINATKYRLGVPVFSNDGPCPICQRPSDMLGDHAIVCANRGEVIARHNHLRNALFEAAQAANLAPRKEEQALIPGNNNKPADVLIPYWTGGRPTALDVTVRSPLSPTYVNRAAQTPGSTLDLAWQAKCRGTLDACNNQGIVFIPLPVETLGGWHKKAVEQIMRIAHAKARSKGQDQDEASRHLFQQLAVMLVKGNTALLNARTPNLSPLPVDGYL